MSKKKVNPIFDDINSEFGVYIPGKETVWLTPLKECLDNIEARFTLLSEENAELREENQKLKDKQYKDKELSKLNEKLEDMRRDLSRGFPVFEEEQERIDKFIESHNKKMHPIPKTKTPRKMISSGHFVYEFTPTEIGIFGTCICSTCRNRAIIESKGDEEKYKKLLEKYNVEFDFSDI